MSQKHGKSRTKEYKAWANMLKRCSDQHSTGFKNYGGRGISVCERWSIFANFFSDLGPAPSKKHSLDRINNDGNYEPGNCRWATHSQQMMNRRLTVGPNSTIITMDGEARNRGWWARALGIKEGTMARRMRNGERRLSVIFSKKPLPRGKNMGRLAKREISPHRT